MGQSDRMRAGPNSKARAGTTINRDPQSGVEQVSPSTRQRRSFMPNTTPKLLAATVLCALLNVFPAAAQQGPSRIRGTIDNVDGNKLTVTARDGTTQKIGLASDVVVTGLVKTTLADVKPGSYVGVTGNAPTRRQPEGDRDPYFS